MAKPPDPRLPTTSIRLDPKDWRALERLARQESARVGSTVTASALVRRIIRAYLRAQRGEP